MRHMNDHDVIVQDDRVSYRAPDGGLVPAARLPDWGIAYLCTVLEWRGDASGWRVLARRATKDDAGETPGIAVADDLRDELGRSSERLARSYTCESGRCRNDVAPHLAAAASAAATIVGNGAGAPMWSGTCRTSKPRSSNRRTRSRSQVADLTYRNPMPNRKSLATGPCYVAAGVWRTVLPGIPSRHRGPGVPASDTS